MPVALVMAIKMVNIKALDWYRRVAESLAASIL